MTLKLLGSFKQRVNSVKGLGVMRLPFTEWNYILKKGYRYLTSLPFFISPADFKIL